MDARARFAAGGFFAGAAVIAVLSAVAMSNAADVTDGAKRDFAGGSDSSIALARSATYVGDEDVSGRGIRRHGSEVARVRMYRLPAQAGGRYLLVHVTSAGQVTDYDVVDR